MQTKYKFTLQDSPHLYIKGLKGIFFSNEWVQICNGFVTVKRGYSWDGCTFAPDFKETYTASLIHDVLYQFNIVDREKADLVFYEILKQNGFRFAKIYYFAVRLFGGLFY